MHDILTLMTIMTSKKQGGMPYIPHNYQMHNSLLMKWLFDGCLNKVVAIPIKAYLAIYHF